MTIEKNAGQLYHKKEVIAMKQEEATLQTKKLLAGSLKRFMEKKPLSKITVSEIITDCNVNRKPFTIIFRISPLCWNTF